MMMPTLPMVCLEVMYLWRVVLPLICFNIVECVQPDRVMCQFGLQQYIPNEPSQPENHHDLLLRGKQSENWPLILDNDISFRNDRHMKVICHNQPQIDLLNKQSEYMWWYLRRTRRWVGREGALRGYSADGMERLYYLSTPEGHVNLIKSLRLLWQHQTRRITSLYLLSQLYLSYKPWNRFLRSHACQQQ